MKKLICIYTCEKDKESLKRFKTTNLYKFISKSKKFQVIEVYAGANTTKLNNNKLLLSCEEDYSNLSIKTHEMIKECVRRFKFDYLIKIDCNVLEYEQNNYSIPTEIIGDFCDEDTLINFMSYNQNNDYFGAMISNAGSEDSLKIWSRQKKLKTKSLEFNHRVPFFIGKLYSLSRNFCEFVSSNDDKESKFFKKYYGGIEDLYIGYLFDKYETKNLKSEFILDFILYSRNLISNKKTQKYINKIIKLYDNQIKKNIRDTEHCVKSDFFDKLIFSKKIARCEVKRKILNDIHENKVNGSGLGVI